MHRLHSKPNKVLDVPLCTVNTGKHSHAHYNTQLITGPAGVSGAKQTNLKIKSD